MRDGQFIKVDVLDTELTSTNEVRVKPGDNASGTGLSQSNALWGSDGFISRPNVKTNAGVCQGLMHVEGNNRRVIATRDGRLNAQWAQLNEGDRAIVTNGDVRLLLKKSTNSVHIYTKDQNGNTMDLSFDGSTGSFTSMIGGSNGTSIIQQQSGSVQLCSGGSAAIILKGNNITFHGDLFNAAVGRGVLGTIAGAPPPPGSSSALIGPAGQVGVPSSTWTIAPRVVLAWLQAWLFWLIGYAPAEPVAA